MHLWNTMTFNKQRRLTSLALLAAALLAWTPVTRAAAAAPADDKAPDSPAAKVEAKKKVDTELNTAAKASAAKLHFSNKYEAELVELSTRRLEFERTVAVGQVRVDAAKAQADASKATDPEGSAKWQREYETWADKVKAAKASLAVADSEYQALVKAYQKSIADQNAQDVILSGETLELFVAEDESFNGTYQVRRGGYIIVPRLGRVLVAGKTVPQIEKDLKASLEDSQLRSATVIIDRAATPELGTPVQEDTIYMAGAFTNVGYWQVPNGVKPTLLISILRTGGTGPNADLHHTRVLRVVGGKGYVEEVNVDAILGGRQLLTADLNLINNDIVYVPTLPRPDYFYVTGNVGHEGIVEIPRGEMLTAYTGILRSGGFSRFANENRVYVLRDVGSGQRVRIPVAICRVMKGTLPDLILDDQDIVVVPERFFSF